MANIGIVGGGQSGLLFGKGMLKSGHNVTIYSAETPSERYAGRISSTQCMTPQAREDERELNMNFWEEELPPIHGFRFRLRSPDGKWFQCQGDLDSPAESVDQRLKFSRWMMHFKDIGGNLVFQRVETSDFDDLEKEHDFIVISTGKGELGNIFERNEERSPYDQPMREIGLIQFRGVDPQPGTIDPDRVDFTILAGLGECFPMPVLTTTNEEDAWTYVHEAVPGSEMDIYDDLDWFNEPEEMKNRIKNFWDEYLPFFSEAVNENEFRLTDERATLQGKFAPGVKHPTTTLPNGTTAMALGDAAITNDPVTGQGSNNATMHAWHAFQMMKDHEGPWDEEFGNAVFEKHWEEYGRDVTRWTNMLLGQPPEHVIKLFAAESNAIGKEIAKGWVNAPYFDPWLYDEDKAEKLLEEKTSPPAGAPA